MTTSKRYTKNRNKSSQQRTPAKVATSKGSLERTTAKMAMGKGPQQKWPWVKDPSKNGHHQRIPEEDPNKNNHNTYNTYNTYNTIQNNTIQYNTTFKRSNCRLSGLLTHPNFKPFPATSASNKANKKHYCRSFGFAPSN